MIKQTTVRRLTLELIHFVVQRKVFSNPRGQHWLRTENNMPFESKWCSKE